MKSLTSFYAGFVSLFFCTLTFVSFSQFNEPCAFDTLHRQRLLSDPLYQNQVMLMEQSIIDFNIQHGAEYRTASSSHIRTIPVVVHIIHDNGPENISDAQVIDAIKQLNEDFRKMPSTPGFGNGVDAEVQFQLTNIDPNGNCTNGIVRIQSSLTVQNGYGFANDEFAFENDTFML